MADAKGPPTSRNAESRAVLKILVIDPKPQSRSILKGSLRSLDIVQAVVERGTAANITDVLLETPVHLIMLELDLGTESAFDVIKAVRAHPSGQRSRFILMSQELDADTRRKATDLGFKGFLTKPFDLQSLERVIRDALGIPAAGAEVPASKELHETLEKLRKISLFSEFNDHELVRLLRICASRNIAAGSYVFKEGDKGDRLYVLVSGQVDIKLTRDGQERTLVTMKPGDCFGEVAIIDSNPRTADAQAATDSTVIEVKEETVSGDNDLIALKMVRQIAILLARKLRAATQK
jgi:CheY-like chemotaxis protein